MSRLAHWVVDASVGAKLFLQESHSDKAETLFDRLDNDPSMLIHVPDLFFAECANILWKHVKRYGYPLAEALANLERLKLLGLQSVPTQDLLPDAFKLAVNKDITAYDACYVALSDRLHAPLVTADESLIRKLKDGSHKVLWLGDLNGL